MGLKELVELSRHYGKNEEFVIAGGGNTSYKDESFLYIKPSGTTLAELTEEGMVRMRRDRLDAIWSRSYSRDPARREEEALADLMAARTEGESKRPSVETLLHELLRQPYVVHTHPALVNGLTCGKRGERIARDLFPDRAVWIPVVNPGYLLAAFIKRAIERHLERGGAYPNILFLQNHGVFVSADTVEEVKAIYERIITNLSARITRRADLAPLPAPDASLAERIGRLLSERLHGGNATKGAACHLLFNREIEGLVASRRSFAPLASLSYTPDHIVYCGHEPLWVPRGREALEQSIAGAIERYRATNGQDPRIVAVEGVALFACGENDAKAQAALAMLLDALKVVAYAESFGGPRLMAKDKRDFIRGWEVERYRAQITGAK